MAYRNELSIQVDQQQRRRKMTKAHRVSVNEIRQKSSRVWRHLMTKESGAGLEGTGSPDGEGGLIQDQHSEDDEDEQASGGLNHLVTRSAWRNSMDVKESHRCS